MENNVENPGEQLQVDPALQAMIQERDDWRNKHQELTNENEVLVAVNKELTLQVEELSNQALQPAASRPVKTAAAFTRNGNNYTFRFRAIVLKDGRKITTAEVLADEALQDELIESKSTMLREE